MPSLHPLKNVEEEFRRLSRDSAFREDMRRVRTVTVTTGDAYLQFVIQFHEFISHRPRPFQAIKDRGMRL
ncbi:MAG: hypothetical protein HPY68_06360 [Candidatus Atribacteria bacterium]|nr:hypothetical protein [Candidatus Atribacteria bacterium]